MSEPKFTRGNLQATRWDGDSWPDKRIGVSLIDGGISESIAICPKHADIDSEEVIANMNLFAEANEMYAMLVKMTEVKNLERDINWDDVSDLLARARGENG